MSVLDSKQFTALGRKWTARFGHNALCAIEDETNRTFGSIVAPFLQGMNVEDASDPKAIVAAMSAIRFSDIRLVLHHALMAAHPDVTREDVGEIIDAIGLNAAMEIVGWAITRAMPTGDADADEEPDAAKKKPKAKPVNRKARRAAVKTG
ncbi:MAG: hypothetical protein WA908_01480 [Pontixanthobacter sp.]